MATIIQSGSFVGATGVDKVLQLRSDVDWMKTYNYTTMAAGVAATTAIEHTWFRGMAARDGLFSAYIGGALVTSSCATQRGLGVYSEGFTRLDSSAQTLGASVQVNGIAAGGVPPVVTAANVATLTNGNIVRLYNITGGQQLGGVDFSIDTLNIGAGTFRLPGMSPIVLAGAGAPSAYRKVYYNPLYYPRNRTISAITQAANAQVTTTVAHGLTVGQEVRFSIPEITALAFGMIELDRTNAIVATVVDAYNFTINVDTTAMTAFAFALTADVGPGMSFPQIIPFGIDMNTALAANVDYLADATVNQGYIGMLLGANTAGGVNYCPAGITADVIYWVAGKSENL